MSPRLPPELESIVFVLALEADYNDGRNLSLVAKRVYNWLTPHIFRVVLFHLEKCVPIKFKESTFLKYGQHTQHLFIEPNVIGEHLNLFPNVTNLALWTDYHNVNSLLPLPLTRLSIGPSDIHTPSPQLFQVFVKLTHLDLVSMCGSWASDLTALQKLLYLPKLTHLCVIRGFSIKILTVFLEERRCPKLEVVIIWGYVEIGSVPQLRLGREYDLDDARLVQLDCSPVEDWQVGARGGVDMWKFADGVIASRRE